MTSEAYICKCGNKMRPSGLGSKHYCDECQIWYGTLSIWLSRVCGGLLEHPEYRETYGPVEIAQEEYARGEIDEDEFERRLDEALAGEEERDRETRVIVR